MTQAWRTCNAGPPFGAVPEKGAVQYPASDPLVLGVGGTTLVANPKSGSYISETTWDTPDYGSSGGGFSSFFARPSYQDDVGEIRAQRGVPDVAADASTSSGLALIFALPSGPINGGCRGDQRRGAPPGRPRSLGRPVRRDGTWARSTLLFTDIAQSANYQAAFHDVAKGDNTVVVDGMTLAGYQAGPGWSPVTGWGTPVASVLVPLLARYDRS